MKKDGEPVSRVELREGIDQGWVVLRQRRFKRRLVVRRLIGWRRKPLAAVIDARVRGQLPEPRLKRPAGVVAPQVAIELDEDLLSEVVRLIEIPEVVVGEAVNAPLQSANQLLKGIEIAAGRLADQLAGLN